MFLHGSEEPNRLQVSDVAGLDDPAQVTFLQNASIV
jgi:hypothetical protein